jgi:hypothetical protein
MPLLFWYLPYMIVSGAFDALSYRRRILWQQPALCRQGSVNDQTYV